MDSRSYIYLIFLEIKQAGDKLNIKNKKLNCLRKVKCTVWHIALSAVVAKSKRIYYRIMDLQARMSRKSVDTYAAILISEHIYSDGCNERL